MTSNPHRGKFARESLSPAEDGKFGCRVMSEQRGADLGRERGGIDDAAALLRQKVPCSNLIGEEHAARVDVEIEIPIFVGQIDGTLHRRDTGIGDENVAATQGLQNALPGIHDGRSLTHVDRDSGAIVSYFGRSPPCSGLVDVTDRDGASLADEEDFSDRAPDPGSATRDKRAASPQVRKGRTRWKFGHHYISSYDDTTHQT